jgi:hypothetical protein
MRPETPVTVMTRLRSGLPWSDSRQGRDFSLCHNVQTGCGTHPVSHAVGTLGGKAARIKPRLICGAIPPLTPYACMAFLSNHQGQLYVTLKEACYHSEIGPVNLGVYVCLCMPIRHTVVDPCL